MNSEMVSLTFKDVGQGDSLILEWMEGEEHQIGIIDCNKKGQSNPVLDHVKDIDCKVISFAILSHPHEDHYSGLLELLQYCLANEIHIGWFGHTAFNMGKDYWKLFEISHNATQELEKIIGLLPILKNVGLLGSIQLVTQNWHKVLAPNIILDALSPAHEEIGQYQHKVRFEPVVNRKAASQAANLLSTVFILTINGIKILVTSDAVTETFDRLYYEDCLSGVSLSVIQAPHHGSVKNYSTVFWDNLVTDHDRKAVVSSGYNLKYKHPHLEVLTRLDALGFIIHATNVVHGMKEFLSLKAKTITLDMVSDLIDTKGGDKVFHF